MSFIKRIQKKGTMEKIMYNHSGVTSVSLFPHSVFYSIRSGRTGWSSWIGNIMMVEESNESLQYKLFTQDCTSSSCRGKSLHLELVPGAVVSTDAQIHTISQVSRCDDWCPSNIYLWPCNLRPLFFFFPPFFPLPLVISYCKSIATGFFFFFFAY